MIADSPLRVKPAPSYPRNGFLHFPYSLLKIAGPLTRTYAAYRAMQTGPNPVFTPAPLARNGCMPIRTLTRQIAQIGIPPVRTDRGTEYLLSISDQLWLSDRFSPTAPHIQIPRIWFHTMPDLRFSELLLLGLYRFKCVSSEGESWAYRLSYADIAKRIGFSRFTWQRASDVLADRGLIVRKRTARGYVVNLPEQ